MLRSDFGPRARLRVFLELVAELAVFSTPCTCLFKEVLQKSDDVVQEKPSLLVDG